MFFRTIGWRSPGGASKNFTGALWGRLIDFISNRPDKSRAKTQIFCPNANVNLRAEADRSKDLQRTRPSTTTPNDE